MISKLLAHDSPMDLARVAAVFVVYVVLDGLTRATTEIGADDLGSASLLIASIGNRWWLYLGVIVVVAAVAILRPHRVWQPWSALEHGSTLRLLAGVLMASLAWHGAMYDYNFIADRFHGIDRALVVLLAIASIYRPVLLLGFVVQFRVINEQFLFPFGTEASKNVDELLVIVLLAVLAGFSVFVATGDRRTSPVILLVGAALAAHFYLPGKSKLAIGWFGETELANLPFASHTAGWLGQTDGGWAGFMSDFYDLTQTPVLVATLILEVGALIAVLHRRLLRLWIPGWIVFHVMTFATTGFFFLSWILVEVGLLTILVLPRFAEWTRENLTPARSLLAAAAVFGGTVFFHPPALAWLDAPVAYGYEVEATGESGTEYHVPISAFAPLDQELSFIRLELGPTSPATGAYGALGETEELRAVDGLTDFEQLAAYEATLAPPSRTADSHAFLIAFVEHVNSDDRRWWYGLGPPDRFWTGRPSPRFDFDEPIQRLDVVRVTSIRNDDTIITRRDLVVVITVGDDGQAAVTETG